MKRILRLLVLATVLAACSADCRLGLYERQNCYQCEGLTNLQMLSQLPKGVLGISIRNSSITKIPMDAFSVHGGSLEELNITGCGVEEIEPNAFRGLDRLRVLGLVDNRIGKLDSSWIQDLMNLKALIVWRNRISEIDARLYDLLPNLEFWDIAHNEMKACLPTELLKKLTKLRKIYIASNPWSYRCRHSMTWYLGSNHIRFIQDWIGGDLLIEECLAHEPNADVDDNALYKCVDRRVGSTEMLQTVARLSEQIRELSKKVTELEAEVAALKKSGY
ncbi:PREDICTED: leucine-rich repeat, immunoglobulin-like domain and transmembrane domain-containing protein 1 [Vollenhovia emeryi]|uniref:leucine-rich repeat, immunoglobulin-like domain and transmembrane domain-containing protein 1 n=1 Tax=Vollenhovia emeryi TaxID=411798 RepID=UPI0005F4E817|nr:PREDICTED: leucine-rich repeat, immunoglobulin-like domain and transmembrane domain-containing protein 1 [Vollenhovia emeryi]